MSVTVTAPATFTTTVTSNAAAATIASDSTTGTAKFNTANFAVSGAGDVTIKDAGVLLTAEVTGTLPVGNGGTGLTAITTLLNSNQAYGDISGTPTLGNVAGLAVGISNLNVLQANAAVSDDDFLTINGTKVEGRSAAETLSDIGAQAALTFGKSSGNSIKSEAALDTNDFLRVGTTHVVGRTNAEVLSDIGAQAVDADLTAIAGLTSAANKGIQFTGSGSAAVYDLTAAGKALLDDADAAAQRTTLGLGTAATSATGDFSPVAGSSSIVTTGTIGTGVWNATAILDTKLDLRVDHGVTFDGGGSVIESAKVVLVPVERAGVIKAATLVGDASGAITITITKYDPAADATTLGSAAAVGSIALATKIIKRDTTLSGWTLAVAEGDVLAFTTGGTIATVTRVTCKLKVELA